MNRNKKKLAALIDEGWQIRIEQTGRNHYGFVIIDPAGSEWTRNNLPFTHTGGKRSLLSYILYVIETIVERQSKKSVDVAELFDLSKAPHVS